ncbi:hypothetical protein PG994_015371 [Apiospora phragmitis]|uniref:Uncharacterized protein n=1 Tax=Apiospora phragmitis TaxID=2905665 RepID=A0ABR1ST27_9PEZI
METTASYTPEPVRPRHSSNNQTTAKLPIFCGDELVTRHAKDMLMNNFGNNHATHAIPRPGRATLRDLQSSVNPGLSVIDTSSSASFMETPPAEACPFSKRSGDWNNMPEKPAQITSGDPQDNEAGGHDRQVLDFQQHPNRLPFVNDKTGKAVDSARGPNIKPCGTLIICPKRKA